MVRHSGSPNVDDLASLSRISCPELLRWRREGLATGRVDNMERKFLEDTFPETVSALRGLLKWDPRRRWSAREALGLGRSHYAEAAANWWNESPRATSKDLPP